MVGKSHMESDISTQLEFLLPQTQVRFHQKVSCFQAKIENLDVYGACPGKKCSCIPGETLIHQALLCFHEGEKSGLNLSLLRL